MLKLSRRRRALVGLLPTLLVFMYGVGEYFSWWDKVSGRAQVVSAIDRLGSSSNFHIRRKDAEYPSLLGIVRRKTRNEDVVLALKNKSPLLFSRMGGTTLRTEVPSEWPPSFFVPDSVPVICVFNYKKVYDPHFDEDVAWVGSLGDLKRWVGEERGREHFWALTVLVAIVSATVVLVGITSGDS